MANNQFAADQIRKAANKKGMKCSRSNFWNLIRNQVYCGKIKVLQYKDEESITVQGKHEAIVSEALFYEVQDVLQEGKETPGIYRK